MTTDTWCVLCVPKVMLNGDNRYIQIQFKFKYFIVCCNHNN